MDAYIHTYVHTCIHACMHTYIHARINACMHAYIVHVSKTHTYVLMYVCINTCMHTWQMNLHMDFPSIPHPHPQCIKIVPQNTCIRIDKRMHTYIHTYIHACIHGRRTYTWTSPASRSHILQESKLFLKNAFVAFVREFLILILSFFST